MNLKKLLRHDKTRKVIGLQIVSLATASSLLVYPTHAFDYNMTQSEYVDTNSVQVTTVSSYSYPVTNPTGVSQQYHGLHRGVDIRAPKGTPAVAIASGMVVEVRQDLFGYGHHVRIAHEGTMSTLYAHLSKIEVTVGQRVEQGQEIGQVGTTGWSTGSHLHFEILQNASAVNPAEYLSDNPSYAQGYGLAH